MTEDRFERLVWQRIDGAISPGDEAWLDARLAAEPGARERYEEIAALARILETAEEVEPPAGLRQRIEDSIDLGRYAGDKKPAISGLWGRYLPLRWDFRFAPVAAAGFLIGVIVYHIFNSVSGVDRPLDITKFYGTMAVERGGRGTAALEIDLAGVRGTIALRRDGDLAISQLDITSEREVEVFLEYEGRSVQFGALGGVDNPLNGVSIDDDTIVLRNLGSGRYFAVFQGDRERVAPLKIRILAGGELLLEEAIHPGAARKN